MPALYPAIDILGGKAVRLEQGDFDRRKVYDSDPLDAARRWVAEGATWLHVVDLDGAREGRPVNLEHLERIAARAGVPVQFGGGLRTVEAVLDAVGAGADRVVIGTVAFTEPEMLDGMIERGGERVRIAVDVRDGVVATGGWLSSTSIAAPDAVAALRGRGAGRLHLHERGSRRHDAGPRPRGARACVRSGARRPGDLLRRDRRAGAPRGPRGAAGARDRRA